jgi:NADH-quinone oxidoreductase subunit N
MATGVKAAAFAALFRVVIESLGTTASWHVIIAGLAVATMIGGNLVALAQRSVKRMLAYSSVAHAGYLLVGVVSAGKANARGESVASLLFYLAVYTATVIGAFAVVGVLERRSEGGREVGEAWDLSRFAGLARRRPGLAFAMAVFMLSLAGVPPTAGFFAKLYLFRAAIGAGFPVLALVGVLTSALGAYYYLRVVLYMYMRPAEVEGEPEPAGTSLAVALGAAAVVVLLLGIVADPLVALAKAAGALG